MDIRRLFDALAQAAKAGENSDSSGSKRLSAVVVGAGLAGLIAALRLLERGVDVTLLDSEPRVGGRIHSVPLGGTYANLGAQYVFMTDNDYMNHYVSRADRFIPEAPGLFDRDAGVLGAVWDGQFVSGQGNDLFLNLPIELVALEQFEQARSEMAQLRSGIMEGRDYVFDKQPASDSWSDLDNRSASDFLAKYHPDVANLFNLFLVPEGGVGVSGTSALLLTGWYGGSEKATYLVEGGNQKLTEAMADDVIAAGGVLRLSTEITEIANTDTGVRVVSGDGRAFVADHAIVTTPATVARKIVAGLSPAKQAALEAVTYGASMQVALHLTDFTTGTKLGSGIFHNAGVNAYLDQMRNPRENQTVISLNVAGEDAHQLDDSGIIRRVSDTLRLIYPGFDPDRSIIDYAIKKWPDGIVTFPPGFLTQNVDALRASSGRVHFAGDYTHSPALDGAAWSGVRAADAVLA